MGCMRFRITAAVLAFLVSYLVADGAAAVAATGPRSWQRVTFGGVSIEVPADYSHRVRSLRASIELTQVQLAKRIGVSFATVNRWENNQSKPARLAWRQILDLEAEIATSKARIEHAAIIPIEIVVRLFVRVTRVPRDAVKISRAIE